MNKNRGLYLIIFPLALIVTLVGCGGNPTQTVQVNPGSMETEVYNTVIANFTQTASAVTPTLPPPSLTIEIIQPSATQVPPSPTNTPVKPTPTNIPVELTPIPQPTPTPRPDTTVVRIWRDDFEGEENWYTGSKEDSYTFEYVNGAYRIYNNLLNSIVWSVRGDTYTDVRLEVDAKKLKGPEDGYYGLICRFVDSKNYYALVINAGNYFGIARMQNGKLGFIQQGEISDKLLKARDEYNRIRVDCIGPILTLYVNDNKVVDAQDDSFASGDVGIGTGNTLEQSGIDVLFDNFEIWQP